MASFMRTSNAGGLLELDGVQVLLDGVSTPDNGYVVTPPDMMGWLVHRSISVAASSHSHPDHFAPEFLRRLSNVILLGPEDVAQALPERIVLEDEIRIRRVKVLPVASPHQGADPGVPHLNYIIQGIGLCIWFMGDADPFQWPDAEIGLPLPDVLIAPFAFSGSEEAWGAVARLAPQLLILTHLPYRTMDPEHHWAAAEAILAAHPEQRSVIPVLGAQVNFQRIPSGDITCSISGRPHAWGEFGL